MRSTLFLSSLMAVALAAAPARAGGADHAVTPSKADPVAKTLPASASASASAHAFGASATKPTRTNTSVAARPADAPATPSKADPATKTLPSSASDTAKANAFGQKGALQRAAHQAVSAAAAAAAHQAAAAGRPVTVGVPNSHASENAAGGSAASHATSGLDKATSVRSSRVPTPPNGRP